MKIKVNCCYCNKEFSARVSDLNRGWARCCTKSCAAHWKLWKTPSSIWYDPRKYRKTMNLFDKVLKDLLFEQIVLK